jgi:uncharacterized protein with HEPN domain
MSLDEDGSRVSDYLTHVLEATRLAITYVEGMAKAEFLAASDPASRYPQLRRAW